MDFSGRKNTGLTCLDTLALKKIFRLDLKEINCELNFSGFLTQNGIKENWIQVRRSSELRVMNFSRQGSLNEPYRESSNVGTPQTYVWRPGAYKTLEEINRDSIMPLNNSKAKWAHLYSLTSHWCLMKTLCKRKLVHRGAAAWKPSRSFQGFPFCPGWSLPTLLPSVPPWSHSTSLTSSKGFSLVRCTCHYQCEYELVSPLGEPDQVSTALASLTLLDSRAMIEESIYLGLVEKSLEDTWHEKRKAEIVSYLLRGMTPHAFDVSSLGVSMAAITHLCLVESFKVLAGTMGVIATIRGSRHTYQLKEEPPDFGVPLKATKGLQGKSHSLFAFYEPKLVYIGVGTMVVWRSKPFQGGGNDVDIALDKWDDENPRVSIDTTTVSVDTETLHDENPRVSIDTTTVSVDTETLPDVDIAPAITRTAGPKPRTEETQRVPFIPNEIMTRSKTQKLKGLIQVYVHKLQEHGDRDERTEGVALDPMSSSSRTHSLGDKALCVLTILR